MNGKHSFLLLIGVIVIGLVYFGKVQIGLPSAKSDEPALSPKDCAMACGYGRVDRFENGKCVCRR